MQRGNWADEPCYYVDCIDGPQFALLAGPFRTKEEADAMLDTTKKAALAYGDPKAWFYAYGTCKMKDGHRDGLLNKQIGI